MSAPVPDWQAAQAKAEAEAAALLTSDPALAAAIRQITTIYSSSSPRSPRPTRTPCCQSWAPKLRHVFAQPGHADWADAFEQRLAKADASAARTIAVEMAVGAAAGEFFGRNPGNPQLTLIQHLLEVLPWAFKPFDAAAEVALCQTPLAAELLDAALRQRAAGVAPSPNHRGGRLIFAWEASPEFRYGGARDAFAYELLRRADRQKYLAAVETLPDPGLAQHVIATAGRNATLADLCLLLREGNRGFDPDGNWIEENAVPFLLLGLCAQHLSGGAEGRNGSPDGGATNNVAAADMMPVILGALAARVDGVPLGYAWLQYLIWSGHARRRWRNGPTTTPPANFLTVLQLLAAWLPLHTQPDKWVAEELEVWRNDRIYAVLMVLLAHTAKASTAADFVAHVLAQDLASSVGVGRFATDAGSHERHIVGSAIGTIPDAANWFSELWAKLFHLRDRARRYHHGRDRHTLPPNVGQVAIIWGLSGLGFIDPASKASRALWVQLEAAARESMLTDGSRVHNDGWREVLCWIGAYWPVIFRDDPSAGHPGSLDDFISFWAVPDTEFTALVQQLHYSGVTIAQLGRSIPDGELLRHGADQLDRMRGVNPGSATAVRRIADDIDAMRTAGTTAVTPPLRS